MDSYATRFPLPKNWPCGVKTAVVHAIALAHVAIVHARRLVLNSPNARTRLDGDLGRAMDEISLLEEELRLKDARMAMIDPHRRPHYRDDAVSRVRLTLTVTYHEGRRHLPIIELKRAA